MACSLSPNATLSLSVVFCSFLLFLFYSFVFPGRGHVILLPFLLHPSVLEPDFDLSFAQVEALGDFDPPSARQIAIGDVFTLQLRRLVTSVRLTTLPVGRDQT